MKQILAALMLMGSLTAVAAPVRYDVDPEHTFPSFEADHFGISIWRGKFNKTTGMVMLDKAGGTGIVDVAIDLNSIDFGHDKLNAWATSAEFFDTAMYPEATYKGKLGRFKNGAPTRIDGELTLHGVTKPVALDIKLFNCKPHPMLKREFCGADALGTFHRDDFGLDAGKPYGFKMDVTLRIQVEAVQAE
ncbi:MAG: polyisoprenoid-binding protein [Burkholderiales bacterium]|nr:polyisoprenoid-binding protein [Burkholderiales bacterium]